MNHTPEHWRHFRIHEVEHGLFQLQTFYCWMPLGPDARASLGLDRQANTDLLPLEQALEIGDKIEQVMVAREPRGRAGRKSMTLQPVPA